MIRADTTLRPVVRRVPRCYRVMREILAATGRAVTLGILTRAPAVRATSRAAAANLNRTGATGGMQNLPHIAVIRWVFVPPDGGPLVEIVGEQRMIRNDPRSARIDRYVAILPEELTADASCRRRVLMNWDQVRQLLAALHPSVPAAHIEASITQVWRDANRFPEL